MKHIKLIKNAIYEIEWEDAFGYNGWFSEAEIDKITNKMPSYFTGYLIKETKDYIIIAIGIDKNEDFAPYNSPKWIPKGAIKNIKRLK